MAEDRYIQQVSESIKDLFDLTARVDERVASVAKRQQQMDTRLDTFMDNHTKMAERVVALESKNGEHVIHDVDNLRKDVKTLQTDLSQLQISLATISVHTGTQEARWRMIFDVIMKTLVIVAAAIIVWKFGLS
tara:strand:+ start:758 stop:1156 length:399 start_codon:yes stop_codon:yes gene_type:complete